MMGDRIGKWIETFTGLRVYPVDSRGAEICIEDIAHHLSNLCRFTGACRKFYSVAEHSVHVLDVVSGSSRNTGIRMQALLHDAAEAYIGDMSRPMKGYSPLGSIHREIESCLMVVIAERFSFPWPIDPIVKAADDAVLAQESRALMRRHVDWEDSAVTPAPILVECLHPEKAERLFLDRFNCLHKQRRVELPQHPEVE